MSVDYRQLAERLWTLLDDIETIDAVTEDHASYRAAVRQIQARRHRYLAPEGYRLVAMRQDATTLPALRYLAESGRSGTPQVTGTASPSAQRALEMLGVA